MDGFKIDGTLSMALTDESTGTHKYHLNACESGDRTLACRLQFHDTRYLRASSSKDFNLPRIREHRQK